MAGTGASRGGRRGVSSAMVLVAALVLAACGSRHSDDELRAALQVTGGTDAGSGQAVAQGAGGATSSGQDTGQATAAVGASDDPSASSGTTTSSGTGGGQVPSSSATNPATATASPGDQGGAAPTAAKEPIVIGSVGPLSGLVGSTLKPGVDGLRVWTQWINDNGGVNGHPVQLLTADDQADPSRHRALVQELVDDRGVVAFVMNGEALSGAGSISFHQERQIPVIGSEGGAQYFYDNSMYFPQMSSGEHLVLMQLGATAQWALANGITKYGSLVCQEAQVCNDSDRLSNEYSDDFGLELVYSAQASLAKPDFTAECLNAQSAGVEIFGVGMDGNSLSRIAASCARQGFYPIYASAASIVAPKHLTDPNIPGILIGSPVAGFPLTQLPAVQEFMDAFARYAPDVEVRVAHMTGWVAGKLFERAASRIEAPTTAEVLEGLWRIQDDDLEGLTHPLTFTRGDTARAATCWWAVVASKDGYSAPFGPDARCIDLL